MASSHHQLLSEQSAVSHRLSLSSPTFIVDAYLPAVVVAIVLILRLWPTSTSTPPSFLSRVFTSFVTPEDVHEYDRQEEKAREEDRHNQATTGRSPTVKKGEATTGYGSTADTRTNSINLSGPEADTGDSETSPLLGSRSNAQDPSVRALKAPKQPTGVKFGLSIINITHLLIWISAIVLATIGGIKAQRIGSEAGFQNLMAFSS